MSNQMMHAGLHYRHPTRLDLLQEPARSQISVVKREAQFEDDYGSGDFPDDEDYNYACETL